MSDFLGRLIGLDPGTGLASLPLWLAGAAAALAGLICVLVFIRAGSGGATGTLARGALVVIGAGISWAALDGMSRSDIIAERRSLDVRVHELLTRAAMPGSALACLDAFAGDLVETFCEKALFQSPEATAAAVSYVSAQVTLLAAFSAHAKRPGAGIPAALGNLRRSVESDRFGLAAHVLAVRDGCTPESCAAFALLRDKSRVAANLAERAYDGVVGRHSAAWPDIATPGAATSPTATLAPAAAPGGAVPTDKGANLFFPSSASIPPVNIMDAEAPPETTAAAPAGKQAPTPQRKRPAAQPNGAAQPGGNGQAQPKARPPVDLNAAVRSGSPPAATPQ